MISNPSLQWHTAKLSADETVNNSTVVVPVLDLQFPTVSGQYYELAGFFKFDSSAVADFKCNWGIPTGTSTHYWKYRSQNGEVAITAMTQNVNLAGGGGGNPGVVFFEGFLIAGDTGAVIFQFAQNTAEVSNTILRSVSWLRWRRG